MKPASRPSAKGQDSARKRRSASRTVAVDEDPDRDDVEQQGAAGGKRVERERAEPHRHHDQDQRQDSAVAMAVRRHSRNAAQAAMKNAALVSAFTGSAQNDGSRRSQYRSIGVDNIR